MTPKPIDFWTALHRKKRLREDVVCSEPWLDEIVTPAAAPQTWLYHAHLYPPGAEATLMRQCPTCRRICPPAGTKDSPCCDCQMEREQRQFLKWALHRQRRELLPELRRLWWHSSLGYDCQAKRWHSTSAITYDDYVVHPQTGLLGERLAAHFAGGRIQAEQGKTFYADACSALWHQHPERCFDCGSEDIRRRNRRRACRECGRTWLVESPYCPFCGSEQVRKRQCLRCGTTWDRSADVPEVRTARLATKRKKQEGGLSPGCCVRLLPEADEVLAREVAYFETHEGQILPYTRRFSGRITRWERRFIKARIPLPSRTGQLTGTRRKPQ